MKTKLVILCALLISVLSIYAQDDNDEKKSKIWYGPKVGVDIPVSMLIETPELITDQMKGNYQAGGFVRFGDKLFLQPEVYYASYKYNATSYEYLKVPVMLGLRILDIGLVSLHATGGLDYTKQLVTGSTGVLNWQVGACVGVLGFLTADLRYTFQKNDLSGVQQIENLIANGGMVNLTVGLKLRAGK